MFGIKFISGGIWQRAFSILLLLSVLGALGALVYVVANPKVLERFTEFYILGLEGKAEGYPEELKLGEEGKVIAGIINREQEVVTYRVEILIDSDRNSGVGPVTLVDGEKWEGVVGFIPHKTGNNQKVEFLLYRQGWDGIYRELRLWVDVQ